MVQMAVLTAIIIVMAFTPLGYLKIGIVSITFLMIPVVIGAILLGPAAGAILGGVFGATSFIQCFGMDPFGTALMSINPFFTFILCFIPRILMGFLVALIFKAVMKLEERIAPYIVASASGALLNTILFVGALVLLFGNNESVQEMFGGSVWVIIATLITANALIEIAVSLVIGTAITKALIAALGKGKQQPST